MLAIRNNERCVLGTAGLGGIWGKVDPKESVDTILTALEAGINAIDTAPAYGDAEMYVGEALRLWSGERPQLSTKVGRLKSYAADEGRYDYSHSGMQRSVAQSLETLGVPQLDILFLHDPDAIHPAEVEMVIESLQTFKAKGYTRKIGVGGNPPLWLLPYLKSGVFDVLMEFNKLNACSAVALKENLPFCIDNKITYFAASPLNMGLLGSNYENFITNNPAWLNIKFVDAAIKMKSIADRHEMALHTLAHRFLLSIPQLFHIVIGASNRQQLNDTLNDFNNGTLPRDIFLEIMNNLDKTELHA
ncbi:aldo/keto reductase [Chitinophaga sp. MM2321]|uniref:aldo/keto reductase n=1 Tax=Chitinophaga sp. MM2321 TaxID=3137178 RepID=UPI0032D5A4A5